MEKIHVERHRSLRVTTARFISLLIFIAAATIAPIAGAQQQTPYSADRLFRERVAERLAEMGVLAPGEAKPGQEVTPAKLIKAAGERSPLARVGARAPGTPASTLGAKGPFEVIKLHPIVYPDIPDEGKKILRLEAAQMDIKDFLQQMALSTGWTVMTTPQVKGSVTAWLMNIPVNDALKVLEINGLYYEKQGNVLYVFTQDEYYLREYGALAREELIVKHASIQDMQQVLTSLQSPAGRMIADPRTGKLVVIDTKDNIEYMKQVLESLDVKLETRAFQLKYAQAEELLDDIQLLLSDRSMVQFDPRTNQILVTDVPERVNKVETMIAKLDIDTARQTFTIKYAEPDDIKSMLETFLSEASLVTMDERTRQVSVATTTDSLEEARDLVEKWDKKLDQVSIEAYILTANAGRVRELGINWQYATEIGNKMVDFQRGPEVLLDPTASLSLALLPQAASSLAAAIDLLATDSDTEILANPRVVVSDGEVAIFKNLTQEPYQESGYSYGLFGGGGETVVPRGINFIDVGTTLDVTPRINDDGWIEMEISAEDSTAVQRDIQSGTGFTTTVPVKTLNSVTTKVLVESGATIVIGGLRVDSASKTVDKIPFFGDIPVLGHAFKTTRRDAEDRELLVFIRPEISREADVREAELLSEFGQNVRKQVVDADRRPFDLGGQQKPFILRHGVDETGQVPPFVPKYR